MNYGKHYQTLTRKGGRNEDISSTASLQPSDDEIRFGHNTLELLQRNNLSNLNTGNGDRR